MYEVVFFPKVSHTTLLTRYLGSDGDECPWKELDRRWVPGQMAEAGKSRYREIQTSDSVTVGKTYTAYISMSKLP